MFSQSIASVFVFKNAIVAKSAFLNFQANIRKTFYINARLSDFIFSQVFQQILVLGISCKHIKRNSCFARRKGNQGPISPLVCFARICSGSSRTQSLKLPHLGLIPGKPLHNIYKLNAIGFLLLAIRKVSINSKTSPSCCLVFSSAIMYSFHLQKLLLPFCSQYCKQQSCISNRNPPYQTI